MAVQVSEYKRKNLLYYIHSVIAIGLTFGIGQLTPIEPLTPLGMDVLGIFIGLLYGWIFVEMIWPSLLALVALGLTEYTTVLGAFASGFSNSITLMILFSLIFAAYIDASGLSQTMANWFVSRKIAIGRPWVFTFLLLLASYTLSAATNVFATIIILWNIFYRLCDTLNFKRGNKYTAIVVVGIVYAGLLGMTIFPFRTFSLLVLNLLKNATGLSVDFVQYTVFNLILTLSCVIIYILVCKYIIKPDVMILMDKNNDRFAKWRGVEIPIEQKISAFLLILFIGILFLPSFLPAGSSPKATLENIGVLGSATLMLIAASLIKVKGKPVIDFKKVASAGVNWELIILFAATMPVGAAMESKEAGVIDALVHLLTPIFAGLSPTLFIILALLIVGVITQFAHNMVLAVILTPMLCMFAVNVGANPIILALLLVYALNIAMVTPGSSAQSAMIHGNSTWLTKRQAYSYTLLVVIITHCVMICLGLPLGYLMF